jgi:hypothetical protein
MPRQNYRKKSTNKDSWKKWRMKESNNALKKY